MWESEGSAGSIFCTLGALSGCDAPPFCHSLLPLARAISDALGIPVIASGGVGNLQHLADGIIEGHASAVLAASIFHFGEYTVPEAKAYMAARGIVVR